MNRAAVVATARAAGKAAHLAARAAARQLPDALMLAGAAAVGFGCWRIYPPAGYIVSGAMVFIVGLLAARAR